MSSKKTKKSKTGDAHRRDMQLRGVRGSRLMLVRILTTVMLCLDVYWILWMGVTNIKILGPVLAPAACVVLDVLAIWEQFRNMTYGLSVGLKRTSLAAMGGLLIVVAALSVTVIFGKGIFFSFFASEVFAFAVCAVGIGVRVWLLYRVNLINTNTDKQYELYRKTVDGKYKF